eukprot:CAMPEP_0116881930 /NCGR_PEP_ID=MMETSP0463-20121206/14017_1 /TAXON_ID=181622 /ORGANISM="Strombidinopsis sp, Strain SopsisLIS2011" /LENGTH=58 /DNA_ID=CAMNT_0004534317 /DNA_START=176 /DNA_END=352 /DNA_ORIENTATION=-
MRRTKEEELAKTELAKIDDKTREIDDARKEHDKLKRNAASIEAKMKKMKNFEEFLLKV